MSSAQAEEGNFPPSSPMFAMWEASDTRFKGLLVECSSSIQSQSLPCNGLGKYSPEEIRPLAIVTASSPDRFDSGWPSLANDAKTISDDFFKPSSRTLICSVCFPMSV